MSTADRRVGTARRGMTLLGKIPAVPKPINLPSQRLESQGLVSDVALVPRGTFSWGSVGRSAPADKKPEQVNKNEDVALPENGSSSIIDVVGLVGKPTQCTDPKANVSPPSSAGSSRSDATSNMSSNSESWDNGLRVYPKSTSASESGGSEKNVSNKTQADSGPESVSIGMDNNVKVGHPVEACPFDHGCSDGTLHQHARQQNEHIPDPHSTLNNDGSARISSKPPPGFNYTTDSYSNIPPFFSSSVPATGTQSMPYGLGTYPRQDSGYNMNGIPFYSGAKSREIVVIHMYGGDPGFYGGYFPHPGFAEHYSRPIMYTQFPLQFGQFENFVFPGQGMLDNGSHPSTAVNPPFFTKQPEFSHGINHSWGQGISMNKDLHNGEAESEAFEIKTHFSKFNVSNKVGRRKTSNWNNKGVYAKSASVAPLPERRVTLLTKVSRHEVIINSLHEDSQDTVVESPNTKEKLSLFPCISKEIQDEKHVDKALLETSDVTDKINDVTKLMVTAAECKMPNSEVDLCEEDYVSRNMEIPVSMESNSDEFLSEETVQIVQSEAAESAQSALTTNKTACNVLSEDSNSCILSSSFVTAHNDEHSMDASDYPCQTPSADSVFDNREDDTKPIDALDTSSCHHIHDVDFSETADEISETEQHSDVSKKICVQSGDFENHVTQSNIKGPDMKRRKDKKQGYKPIARKSKVGCKLFVPKVQTVVENSKVERESNSACNARGKENPDSCVDQLAPGSTDVKHEKTKKQGHKQSATNAQTAAAIPEIEECSSIIINDVGQKENVGRCIKQWKIREIHAKHDNSDKQESKQTVTKVKQFIPKMEEVFENLEVEQCSNNPMNVDGQKENVADRCVKQWRIRETSSQHGEKDKQEYKQLTTKSKLGCKVFVPKIQNTIENSKIEQRSGRPTENVEPKKEVLNKNTGQKENVIDRELSLEEKGAGHGKSKKRENKQFVPKSKMESKTCILELQKTAETINIDNKDGSETQSALTEVQSQSVVYYNEDSTVVKAGKETCGSIPVTTDLGAEKLMETVTSPKNSKLYPAHLSKSNFPVPDGQAKNMKWKKVQKNGSLTNNMSVWRHHVKHQQKAWSKVTA